MIDGRNFSDQPITNLATNTTLNAKINEIKKELPSITNLATTAALTTVEQQKVLKIPNVSDLVKKADYDTKILEIEYFTTSDYNKFSSNTIDETLTQNMLVHESDLNEKIKTLPTKEEIKTLATKAELKQSKMK